MRAHLELNQREQSSRRRHTLYGPAEVLQHSVLTSRNKPGAPQVYEQLLATKAERWAASQKAAVEAVAELGDFFSGSKVLSKHIKDDNLKAWFASIQLEVEKLASEERVVAGRRIQQLIAALEAVEQFHQFDRVLQTKQYLLETRQHLMDMVRAANVQVRCARDADFDWKSVGVGSLHTRL
jgi:WASH complex subunit strumpellin